MPRPIPDYADVMAKDAWCESVENGLFNEYDGHGYWIVGGLMTDVDSFQPAPPDATGVAWFNK